MSRTDKSIVIESSLGLQGAREIGGKWGLKGKGFLWELCKCKIYLGND